ncbi:uncharacterized protein LOC135830672 [Sycon ciliatum]|uniref:uncharacterized protein LOC135830672 n=1 Tax=Sycon ciliatum TaxID=27933 RepID=UPI0031F6FA0B
MCEHASSTVTKYSQTFDRFVQWCRRVQVNYLPASADHVALYLVELLSAASSSAPISSAVSAIAWAHRKVCLPSPTDTPLVGQTILGCQRLLARPAHKKTPITMAQLRQLVCTFDRPRLSLMHLQMLALITLGFRGFMRWDDMSRLKVTNIEVNSQHMTVFLDSRKNDQFREGHLVPISRCPDRSVCAVFWMETFLDRAQHQPGQPLFGKIQMDKGVQVVHGSMTYSRAREMFLDMLREAGVSDVQSGVQEYGLHSLRAGGVSSALRAPGIPVRLVQRHGGWKHLESMQGYVAESADATLQVTRGMR